MFPSLHDATMLVPTVVRSGARSNLCPSLKILGAGSSSVQVVLAFGLAVSVDADVMLVDELVGELIGELAGELIGELAGELVGEVVGELIDE